MPFFDPRQTPSFEPVPGCRLTTPAGDSLMLSHVQMDDGAQIPPHAHHHEQAGVVIEGTLELTIGGQTRRLEKGEMYIIPGDTPHAATAIGPTVVMDVFTPIREDYALAMQNAAEPADNSNAGNSNAANPAAANSAASKPNSPA